jgi:adenosine/AMP kinase
MVGSVTLEVVTVDKPADMNVIIEREADVADRYRLVRAIGYKL